MRTEKKWEEFKPRYLAKFPPRIQHDLLKFKILPWTSEIESLFIYGEVGTGKTLLAASIMMEELKRIYLDAEENKHNRTLFISFPDMLQEIKATFGNEGNTNEVLHKYLDAHLLVLDDFITTRPTDWVLEILYYLINHRYEYMRKTIITCNFSLEDLERILGDQRITSRIDRSYEVIHKV